MAAIFFGGAGSKIFSILPKVHCLDTLWVKILTKIALSCTVKEKVRKFKMACIFGRGNFFLIAKSHRLDTLWVENFDEIALSRTVKEIEANLCFAIFGKYSKNSKWPPFLVR